MSNRLVTLAKNDLANTQDNLCRARIAARNSDVNARWGQSDKTLAQIIAGYEEWEREAMAALEHALKAAGDV